MKVTAGTLKISKLTPKRDADDEPQIVRNDEALTNMSSYEQTLLSGWEEVHKKSQLTLWILLALKDGPKHMADVKVFISGLTNHLIVADDKSMYRALRRFSDAEMLDFVSETNEAGPDRKVYRLTPTGRQVLDAFIARNISGIFLSPRVQSLLTK